MYKLFLCLRYLLHRRIVIVPILAVMLCVAMNLIVVSLMGGFLDKLRDSVRGLFGDVLIGDGSLKGFGYYEEYTDSDGNSHPGLLDYLAAISVQPHDRQAAATRPELADLLSRPPVIKQATPVIETYALLRLPQRSGFTNTVQVVGIRPSEYVRVTNFQDGLYWQKPGTGDPPSMEPMALADRESQARLARGNSQAARAQAIEARLSEERQMLEFLAARRSKMHWVGPPDLAMAPGLHQDQAGIPLRMLYPNIDEPVGAIVGIRVFYPMPDSQGKFRRQVLPPPGGERVQLSFVPIDAAGRAAEKPDMKEFFLVDTSCSQIQQIDRNIAYVPFDRLQQYLNMHSSRLAVYGPSGIEEIGTFVSPARATRVLVKLADGVDLKQGRQAVQEAVDAWIAERRAMFAALPAEWQAKSIYFEPFAGGERDLPSRMDVLVWEEANRDFYMTIAMQRSLAIVMVGIVSLTVIALIWVIFIMIVVEKTKDIGIVKSVGGSAGGVASIFIVWAGVLGAIGAALGGLLGGLFVRHMNGIERWLSAVASRLTGTQVNIYDPRTYLFDSIPARFQWSEFLLIGGFAVLAAMVGAVLPAWRAGRMNVVETLRYE